MGALVAWPLGFPVGNVVRRRAVWPLILVLCLTPYGFGIGDANDRSY